MVGAIGFEPTTYGTQNRRATKLRHAPTARSLAGKLRGEKVQFTTAAQIMITHHRARALFPGQAAGDVSDCLRQSPWRATSRH